MKIINNNTRLSNWYLYRTSPVLHLISTYASCFSAVISFLVRCAELAREREGVWMKGWHRLSDNNALTRVRRSSSAFRGGLWLGRSGASFFFCARDTRARLHWQRRAYCLLLLSVVVGFQRGIGVDRCGLENNWRIFGDDNNNNKACDGLAVWKVSFFTVLPDHFEFAPLTTLW